LGLFHTGFIYCIYFYAIRKLPGQKTAILSYIDPLVAILLSLFLLGEGMSLWQIIGGSLILGFTFWNELSDK
jgi:drug/metabolite transporter (DMT)-like permease